MSKMGAVGDMSWLFAIDTASQQLYLAISSDGTANAAGSKLYTPIAGWKFCVGVYDGAHITVYINGVAGTPVDMTGPIYQSTEYVRIGHNVGTVPQSALQRILSRAVNSDEVKRAFRREKSLFGVS
jgi:hypothetical protein